MVEKTELKTLKDIVVGNFDDNCKAPIPLWAQDDLKDAAKNQITKLCNDMNIDIKTISPGFYSDDDIFSFVYEQPKNKHVIMTICTVSWVKYFFNL